MANPNRGFLQSCIKFGLSMAGWCVLLLQLFLFQKDMALQWLLDSCESRMFQIGEGAPSFFPKSLTPLLTTKAKMPVPSSPHRYKVFPVDLLSCLWQMLSWVHSTPYDQFWVSWSGGIEPNMTKLNICMKHEGCCDAIYKHLDQLPQSPSPFPPQLIHWAFISLVAFLPLDLLASLEWRHAPLTLSEGLS